MAFKLGREKRNFKHSGNVKLVRTPLEKDTVAEARNDGTIVINSEKNVTGDMLNRAVKHEMKHMCDMYDDLRPAARRRAPARRKSMTTLISNK